jgi:aspartate-semialdehyde dehydrogenase
MSEDRLPCAVLGASGYIGQHFVRLLADHPWFEPTALAGGERSEHRTLTDVWQLESPPPPDVAPRRILRVSPGALERQGIRVAFSALPSGAGRPIESELVRRGISVFTNASDHRMDANVPLLVPEVNASHLALARRRGRGRGVLVANPNCSAAGLVLGLAPLLPLVRPRAVHVSTYQALSGAGYPGLPSLAIADNVVPYVRNEEEKVAAESAKMLGVLRGGRVAPVELPFVVQCARVGTRDGHLEAVTVHARARPSRTDILRAFRTFDPLSEERLPSAPHPPVVLRSEPDRPQPLRDRWAGEPARARGMAVTVGRVRWNPPFVRLFLLSHNAVRGGAGGSVLNAELAVRRGLIGPRAGVSP